jgi:hypothetical protein
MPPGARRADRGQADAINIGLAWTYVALRIVHSPMQCTVSIITLRFAVFTLSTIALVAIGRVLASRHHHSISTRSPRRLARRAAPGGAA